jgi:hypothetical protein
MPAPMRSEPPIRMPKNQATAVREKDRQKERENERKNEKKNE